MLGLRLVRHSWSSGETLQCCSSKNTCHINSNHPSSHPPLIQSQDTTARCTTPEWYLRTCSSSQMDRWGHSRGRGAEGGPPHDDSASLQVYKEAAALPQSSWRWWPGCRISAFWSAAWSCCWPNLQVNIPQLKLEHLRDCSPRNDRNFNHISICSRWSR